MMHVQILSPDAKLLEAEASEVRLPTTVGPIAILSGHEPLLVELSPGTIVVKKPGGDESVATLGGFVEVTPTTVSVMTDSTELASDLSELKIREATERAKQLATERVSSGEVEAASALLTGSLMKIKGVKRRRTKL